MTEYKDALGVVQQVFFMTSAVSETESKLRLVSQILIQNIQLSGLEENTQEWFNAWQLVAAVESSANALNNVSAVFAETSLEAAEILGHEFPKAEEKEAVH